MKDVPSYYGFWAKTPNRGSGYHLLPYHLIDTGVVAGVIWENGLPDAFKKSIAIALGTSVEDAGRILSFVASLHDIGKATPAFQGRDRQWKENLRNAGFEFLTKYSTFEKRHDLLTQHITKNTLPLFGTSGGIADELGTILSGHHGTFSVKNPNPSSMDLGTGEWEDARKELVSDLYAVFGSPDLSIILPLDDSTSVLIAGLVSVTDWIASNRYYFHCCEVPEEFDSYAKRSNTEAVNALQTLKWMLPSNAPIRDFQVLFPGKEPRPVQKAVIEMADKIESQTLVLIEVPTGEGKTEAAMYLASYLSGLGQQGCYFALPTQATSNQMFGRVAGFLKNKYGSDVPNHILLHGHASLSADIKDGEVLYTVSDVGSVSNEESDRDARIRIDNWFTFAKRGLLSLFGTGTIDQILLASIRTRHVFVRLFGLANKVVILDEVHAYDFYMVTLLERLIEWLKELGCSVIVLSATLPKLQREGLFRAFGNGIPLFSSYPRISVVAEGYSESIHVETSSTASRKIELEWFGAFDKLGIERLGKDLQEKLKDGGCAAVVCNTVVKAQEVYSVLKDLFPDDDVVDLFHARYLFKEREQREKRCLQRFGDDSKEGVTRPCKAIMVATQVIEQSLDLDFDFMYVEPAPVDLMIQRAGRLYRHHREGRRGNPVLTVLGSREERFESVVYDNHVMLRTWLILRGRDHITSPGDVEELVEEVYKEGVKCPDSTLVGVWENTLQEKNQFMSEERDAARRRYVPRPNSTPFGGLALSSLQNMTYDWKDEESPDFWLENVALTRWMGKRANANFVCFFEAPDGRLCFDEDFAESIDIHQKPSLEDTKKMLKNSVSVSGGAYWLSNVRKVEIPETWKETALLSTYRTVPFKNRSARIGDNYLLFYDPELGIRKGYVKNG